MGKLSHLGLLGQFDKKGESFLEKVGLPPYLFEGYGIKFSIKENFNNNQLELRFETLPFGYYPDIGEIVPLSVQRVACVHCIDLSFLENLYSDMEVIYVLKKAINNSVLELLDEAGYAVELEFQDSNVFYVQNILEAIGLPPFYFDRFGLDTVPTGSPHAFYLVNKETSEKTYHVIPGEALASYFSEFGVIHPQTNNITPNLINRVKKMVSKTKLQAKELDKKVELGIPYGNIKPPMFKPPEPHTIVIYPDMIKDSPFLAGLGFPKKFLEFNGLDMKVVGKDLCFYKDGNFCTVSIPGGITPFLWNSATTEEKAQLYESIKDTLEKFESTLAMLKHGKENLSVPPVWFHLDDAQASIEMAIEPFVPIPTENMEEFIKSAAASDIQTKMPDFIFNKGVKKQAQMNPFPIYEQGKQQLKPDFFKHSEDPLTPTTDEYETPALIAATNMYQRVKGTKVYYVVVAIGESMSTGNRVAVGARIKGVNKDRISLRVEFQNPTATLCTTYLTKFGLTMAVTGHWSAHFSVTNTTPGRLLGAFLADFPDVDWSTPMPSITKLEKA